LALVLLALVVVDAATWPREPLARESLPLFTPWDATALASVRVVDPTAAEGARELEAVRDGEGPFRLKQAFGFPARDLVVDNLVHGLASMTTLDLLTEDPKGHARYGLTEAQAVRITLRDGQGGVLADLFQGDLAPGGRACYVRRADGDQVYRAPLFVQRVRADVLPWIEGRWMPLDESLLQRVTVEVAGEPTLDCRLIPGSRLEWRTPDGRTLGATKMRTLLSSLSRATIGAIEAAGEPAWAAGDRILHLEVEQAGGLVWRGSLGPAVGSEGPLAGVERDGEFSVRLAPAISDALRGAIRGLRE